MLSQVLFLFHQPFLFCHYSNALNGAFDPTPNSSWTLAPYSSGAGRREAALLAGRLQRITSLPSYLWRVDLNTRSIRQGSLFGRPRP
jgi:hypothetical protein